MFGLQDVMQIVSCSKPCWGLRQMAQLADNDFPSQALAQLGDNDFPPQALGMRGPSRERQALALNFILTAGAQLTRPAEPGQIQVHSCQSLQAHIKSLLAQ